MRFFEGFAQFLIREDLIPFKDNLANFNPALFINDKGQIDRITNCGIVLLTICNYCILKTLLIIILLDNINTRIENVIRQLTASLQLQLIFQQF